jgi:cell wall-associated NlpC family hydrolase
MSGWIPADVNVVFAAMFVLTRTRLLAAALSAALAVAAFATPAHAAARRPVGRLMTVRQDTFTHVLRITGWADDPSRPQAAVRVRVLVDGVPVGTVRADKPSPHADRAFGLSGGHGYALTLRATSRAHEVVVRSRGVVDGPMTTLASRPVTHYYPPAGQRIIDVARRFVGDRYVDGGASPQGFDCSGYTQYVYAQAHVHRLPHNSETQMREMRRISRAQARPGDLVFYLSGGVAYHVAIYAGHGWQYAAATPRDGVRHQPVWSSDVRYGTDWH